MSDHDHSHDSVREREVIVTDNGRSGGPGGMLMAIVAIIVVIVVGFFAIQAIGGGDGGSPIPDEIDVNINPGDEG